MKVIIVKYCQYDSQNDSGRVFKMYGLIMANGEAREKFAKEVKFTNCLSGRVDVTRADNDIACSDMITCKDFVIIQADGSGVTEKVILRFAFAAANVGKVDIYDCGGIYTIIYKNHCKDMFDGDLSHGRFCCEDFLCRLDGCIRKQSTSANLRKIADFFTKIGLFANLAGYNFLLSAVKYSLNSPELLLKITTRLYPIIAENYHTTSKAVERNIRNAIEMVCIKGKIFDVANKYYGGNFSVNDKPTNSEFIAYLTTIAQN